MRMRFRPSLCLLALTALVAGGLAVNVQAQDEPTPAVDLPRAEKVETSSDDDITTTVEDASGRPLAASVYIRGGSEINGTLLNSTELNMRCAFGKAVIPLAEVAGIKMASEGAAATTVILHNGDSVTGAVELDSLTVQTEWGKAEINSPNISSILFTKGVRWVSNDGISGTRWSLTELESKPASTPGRTGVTNRGQVVQQGTVIRSFP